MLTDTPRLNGFMDMPFETALEAATPSGSILNLQQLARVDEVGLCFSFQNYLQTQQLDPSFQSLQESRIWGENQKEFSVESPPLYVPKDPLPLSLLPIYPSFYWGSWSFLFLRQRRRGFFLKAFPLPSV
ncbi:hypothetical protein VNO77_31551 [Canavalia gladiata]|uniref:Uncharacterized protein n=1 Tax=Canavalia gladiata TaxID=3824 RepID=A0AAN9Q7S0_CANGL